MTELYRYFWEKARALALASYESVAVMYVDRHYHEIATVLLSTGGKSQCAVHPRDVFRIAIRLNAYAFLLAHTHTSGYTTPSVEDHTATNILESAGKHLRIPLIGHIVVTKNAWELVQTKAVDNSS